MSYLTSLFPLTSLISLLFSHTPSFSYHDSLLTHISLSLYPTSHLPVISHIYIYIYLSYFTHLSSFTISSPTSTLTYPFIYIYLSYLSSLSPLSACINSLSAPLHIFPLTHTHIPLMSLLIQISLSLLSHRPLSCLKSPLSFFPFYLASVSLISPTSLSPLSPLTYTSPIPPLFPHLSYCISPISHLSILPYPLSHITIPSLLSHLLLSLNFAHLSRSSVSSRVYLTYRMSLNIPPLFISYYTFLFSLTIIASLTLFSQKCL